ncbi:hypothetical protein LINPERHAP1_LOCUS24872 [Linum perenne]
MMAINQSGEDWKVQKVNLKKLSKRLLQKRFLLMSTQPLFSQTCLRKEMLLLT